MCGRFTLRADGNALAQHFEIDDGLAGASAQARYNIAPTQAIPVVRLSPNGGKRELARLRWGLVPPWAKPGEPLPALFNARAETLDAKPAFRGAFRARRCLIPADGFYEWKPAVPGTAPGSAGRKQPWFVHRQGDGLFAFAGLWEGESCTIVTTAPTPQLKALHDRMPAFTPPENYAAWLDPAPLPPADRLALLRPPGDLELYPVGLQVNRAAYDGPDCIAPA
jgi:putative SOS response-associated peptidase YedK